jgi:hypothetical protein
MAQTIGSLDLNAFSDLYSDSTQYFWFEGNASATYGAGAHVTLVPDTTFINNPTGQNILMNTDGFSIRNGLLPMMTLDNNSLDFNIVNTSAGTCATMAMFGANGSQIGVIGESHLKMDYRSMTFVDRQNDTYFYVGDLRDKNTGTYQVEESFIATNNQTQFWVDVSIYQIVTIKVDDVVLASTEYTYTTGTTVFYLVTPSQEGATVEIIYTTQSPLAKAYTLGVRKSNNQVGSSSFVEGYDNAASKSCSHAEGRDNVARGTYAHAEGRGVIASGYSAHAEGTHTVASGNHSHAEGYETTAKGYYSHAGGEGTIAKTMAQTAIGMYNIETQGVLIIIGNGTADDMRSNALTVGRRGEVQLYIDVDSAASETTAATSGIDMDLFNAIRDLGWYSSVIS